MKDDYFIRIPHFYLFEYHEGDKVMIIELDFREKILYLQPDLIKKWKEPYDRLVITEQDKKRILNNIKKCLLKKWRPEEVIIVDT